MSENDQTQTKPRLRGFAALTLEQRRIIASMGGVAAHEKGTAHQFSTEEAVAAGRKRGKLSKLKREEENGQSSRSF